MSGVLPTLSLASTVGLFVLNTFSMKVGWSCGHEDGESKEEKRETSQLKRTKAGYWLENKPELELALLFLFFSSASSLFFRGAGGEFTYVEDTPDLFDVVVSCCCVQHGSLRRRHGGSFSVSKVLRKPTSLATQRAAVFSSWWQRGTKTVQWTTVYTLVSQIYCSPLDFKFEVDSGADLKKGKRAMIAIELLRLCRPVQRQGSEGSEGEPEGETTAQAARLMLRECAGPSIGTEPSSQSVRGSL